jgi:hypothetical protein
MVKTGTTVDIFVKENIGVNIGHKAELLDAGVKELDATRCGVWSLSVTLSPPRECNRYDVPTEET